MVDCNKHGREEEELGVELRLWVAMDRLSLHEFGWQMFLVMLHSLKHLRRILLDQGEGLQREALKLVSANGSQITEGRSGSICFKRSDFKTVA